MEPKSDHFSKETHLPKEFVGQFQALEEAVVCSASPAGTGFYQDCPTCYNDYWSDSSFGLFRATVFHEISLMTTHIPMTGMNARCSLTIPAQNHHILCGRSHVSHFCAIICFSQGQSIDQLPRSGFTNNFLK